MKTLFYVLIGSCVAFILALPFLCANQTHDYQIALQDASVQTESKFAGTSPGHARLMALYGARERDRAARRAVTTWEPNACERDALAVLFDAQARAGYAVPEPWLLKTEHRRPPALSGTKLTPECERALNSPPG